MHANFPTLISQICYKMKRTFSETTKRNKNNDEADEENSSYVVLGGNVVGRTRSGRTVRAPQVLVVDPQLNRAAARGSQAEYEKALEDYVHRETRKYERQKEDVRKLREERIRKLVAKFTAEHPVTDEASRAQLDSTIKKLLAEQSDDEQDGRSASEAEYEDYDDDDDDEYEDDDELSLEDEDVHKTLSNDPLTQEDEVLEDDDDLCTDDDDDEDDEESEEEDDEDD